MGRQDITLTKPFDVPQYCPNCGRCIAAYNSWEGYIRVPHDLELCIHQTNFFKKLETK